VLFVIVVCCVVFLFLFCLSLFCVLCLILPTPLYFALLIAPSVFSNLYLITRYVLNRKTGEQTISLWILLLCDGITTNMCLAERQENKQSLFGFYCSAMVLQRICA
jgi:hypothetical protein